MLDLVVPFILDHISTVKMGDGLTWGGQVGGIISVSVILIWHMDASCLHLGSVGSAQRFMYGNYHPRGKVDFLRDKNHTWVAGPLLNNIAKQMTLLLLSSLLSHY